MTSTSLASGASDAASGTASDSGGTNTGATGAAAARVARLRGALEAQPVDGLLVSFPADIRYLTGFVGDDSLLIVDATSASIVSDPRYDEYLEPWRAVPGIEVAMGERHRLERSVREHCRRRGLARLGLQAEHISVAARDKLAAELAGTMLVDTTDVVGDLRMRKDGGEVAAIERSIAIQQEALTAALGHLRIGMTELEFCARLEYEMKVRGADGPSFGTIIGAGPRSSVIHHTSGDGPIEAGPLLVDWGAKRGGYCSDMTRTFFVGAAADRMDEVYGIVLEAQLAAIDACAPGISCAEIDAVARGIIDRAGYGAFFGHGLGHGLGLEIHERPYFNDLETETILEPGMVMTVEPGIYLPGVGGVRIEDDVVITESGVRVLSDRPKDLDSALIEAGTG